MIMLKEIPLGPFTSPTGPKDYACHCNQRFYGDDSTDPDCEHCEGTGRVTGEYEPCQRASSHDDRISTDKSYLAKIHGGWHAGRFSEQWYGWSFNNWGTSGIQLDSIEGPLYEICE